MNMFWLAQKSTRKKQLWRRKATFSFSRNCRLTIPLTKKVDFRKVLLAFFQLHIVFSVSFNSRVKVKYQLRCSVKIKPCIFLVKIYVFQVTVETYSQCVIILYACIYYCVFYTHKITFHSVMSEILWFRYP